MVVCPALSLPSVCSLDLRLSSDLDSRVAVAFHLNSDRPDEAQPFPSHRGHNFPLIFAGAHHPVITLMEPVLRLLGDFFDFLAEPSWRLQLSGERGRNRTFNLLIKSWALTENQQLAPSATNCDEVLQMPCPARRSSAGVALLHTSLTRVSWWSTEAGHRQNHDPSAQKPPPGQDIFTLAQIIFQNFRNPTRDSMSAITGEITIFADNPQVPGLNLAAPESSEAKMSISVLPRMFWHTYNFWTLRCLRNFRQIAAERKGAACLNPIVITLVTSRSPTLATKLKVPDGLTMKRCIAMALLVCSSTSVVLSHHSSLAQQDKSEVERKVLSKVAPTYPDLARKTNIHGAVKLGVVIAPDGRVESTRVIGGNPVLIQAAVDAVRKWKYEAGPQRTNEVIELKFNTR